MPREDENLTPAQVAESRARLYGYLAHLVGGPVEPWLLPFLETLELHAFGEAGRDRGDEHRFDAAAWAVRYESVLGRGVLPYAGVFLRRDGLVGGESAAGLYAFFEQVGYDLQTTASRLPTGHLASEHLAADHLAHLLGCLAHLCAGESDAWADGRQQLVGQIRDLERELLGRFLLPWLPPLCVALGHVPDPLYAGVGELLGQAVAQDWELLASRTRSVDAESDAESPDRREFAPEDFFAQRVEPPNLAVCAWREILEFLTTPVDAGILISGLFVRQLGVRFGVAVGFGGRARQLETLIASLPPAELPGLWAALHAYAQTWHTDYTRLGGELPGLSPWAAIWSRRSLETVGFLAQIQTQIDNLPQM